MTRMIFVERVAKAWYAWKRAENPAKWWNENEGEAELIDWITGCADE